LNLENQSFDQWSRRTGSADALKAFAERSTHVLLAISDSAIEPFLMAHPFLRRLTCIHFSGALVTPFAASVHPLMTFGPLLYSVEDYRQIPFIVERERPTTLPGLGNSVFEIAAELKPLYHALCAAGGNFTVMLWEAVFARFASLGLPREVLLPYMVRTTTNLLNADGESVLTGPLKRGDFETVEKHLAALDGDPLADVYRAFVRFALPQKQPTPFPLGGLV
jgi:predicted short-subunit dehydrogenase-like oxidoreductase (DUF2520 family)